MSRVDKASVNFCDLTIFVNEQLQIESGQKVVAY